MSVKLFLPPSEEPVSLAEARAHLRLESGEDDYLADLYEHRRGDEGIGKSFNEAVESLLWPDRIDLL